MGPYCLALSGMIINELAPLDGSKYAIYQSGLSPI